MDAHPLTVAHLPLLRRLRHRKVLRYRIFETLETTYRFVFCLFISSSLIRILGLTSLQLLRIQQLYLSRSLNCYFLVETLLRKLLNLYSSPSKCVLNCVLAANSSQRLSVSFIYGVYATVCANSFTYTGSLWPWKIPSTCQD